MIDATYRLRATPQLVGRHRRDLKQMSSINLTSSRTPRRGMSSLSRDRSHPHHLHHQQQSPLSPSQTLFSLPQPSPMNGSNLDALPGGKASSRPPHPPIPKIQALSAAGRASESEAEPMHCLLKLPIARPPPSTRPPAPRAGGGSGGRERRRLLIVIAGDQRKRSPTGVHRRPPTTTTSLLTLTVMVMIRGHCSGRNVSRRDFSSSLLLTGWIIFSSSLRSSPVSQMSTNSPSDVNISLTIGTNPPSPPSPLNEPPTHFHHSLPFPGRLPACLPAFPPRIAAQQRANERTNKTFGF